MKNKKILIIILCSLFCVLLFLGVGTYFYVTKSKDINFKLKGKKEITIEVFSEYHDEGYILTVNNKTQKATLSGKANTKKLGTYKINYTYTDKFKKKHKIERIINVVDTTAPVLTLKGENTIDILIGEEFNDPGYEVKDNYDKEANIKVEVKGKIDSSNVASFELTYTCEDSSKNKCEDVKRTVNVIKPKKVVTYTEVKSVEKETNTETLVSYSSNTITANQFKNNGIYYEGYLKGNNGSVTLILKSADNSYEYPMSVNGDYYSGVLDLTSVVNGDYTFYIKSTEEAPLYNNMELINKIVRAKVGNKLVSLTYNSGIQLNISDFAYQYDILIDVGHGGSDNGASNAYSYEKDMNLRQSLYEKCRYEEMGLRVFIIRTNDSYGVMMGDSSWNVLTQRSYALGYYGAVTKIVYSNHHNSSPNPKSSGYEILTPAQFDSLSDELTIASIFNGIDPYGGRMYARDYESGGIYYSNNGESYNFKNYYAVIRIPYELYNKKVVIYEGTYLSYLDDYHWYWTNGNWKQMSEVKIKQYVTSAGGTYSSATSCQ